VFLECYHWMEFAPPRQVAPSDLPVSLVAHFELHGSKGVPVPRAII
jgi:hypothetical protein